MLLQRFLAMMAALLAGWSGAEAADASLVPRVVLQVEHATIANAGGFSPDGTLIVTASSGDNSVAVRDATTGGIIDRFRLPYDNNKFPAFDRLIVAPDKDSATIEGWDYAPVTGPVPGNVTIEVATTLTVDLRRRNVVATTTGEPVRKPSRPRFGPQPLAMVAGPGGSRLSYDSGGQLQLEQAGRRRPIARGTLRRYALAQVSRDGGRLAMLAHALVAGTAGEASARWQTTIEPLALGGAPSAAAVTVPGFYDRVLWIDADTVLLAYENRLAALSAPRLSVHDVPATWRVVDLPSGAVRAIPARCAVIAARGRLIGIGRIGECPTFDGEADRAAERGLWRLDPHEPNGVWQRFVVPDLAGHRLDRISVFPDGARLVVSRAAGGGAYALEVIDIDRRVRTAQIDLAYDDYLTNRVMSLAVSSDGRQVIGTGTMLYFAWTPGRADLDFREELSTDLLASDGKTLVAGMSDVQLSRVDAASGRFTANMSVDAALAFDFLPGKPVFVSLSQNGGACFWDTRTWTEILTVYSFAGGKFFAVDPAGRYDTNLGPDTNELRWLMDDAPLQSLGAQTFMRNLYEPGLLRRTLACVAAGCAAEFAPLPSLRDLNRVLPMVEIVEVTQAPGVARVTVEVSEGSSKQVPNGKTLSGVYDLRLFRDGRLVRQTPALGIARDEGKTLAEWRAKTAVPLAMEHSRYRETFEVTLPRRGGSVEFSAYAFNEDRVKGETARASLVVPAPAVPPRRRLVVVAIGVDATRNPQWRLSYAANDAGAIAAALKAVPDAEVTVIPLVSDARGDRATKRTIRAVLLALGGAASEDNGYELAEAGIDLAALAPVGPDDAVVISFSGHGTTLDRQFYLLPSDTADDAGGAPVPGTMISSVELTAWLRQLDAGEIAFVIDACHSAASVDAGGFKPGPMGDPGLGQLAFDKGIRILAATQADDVALEDGKLGHGLLSFALDEGLRGKADADGDGAVTLGEWLGYGVQRMPGLAAELRDGTVRLSRGVAAPRPAGAIVWFDAPDASVVRVQQPTLFDFTGTAGALVLRRGALTRRPGA